jgi:hypothetical protein
MAGLVLPITQAEWGEDFDLSELYDNEPKANDVTAFGPAPDSIGQATGAPAIVASAGATAGAATSVAAAAATGAAASAVAGKAAKGSSRGVVPGFSLQAGSDR